MRLAYDAVLVTGGAGFIGSHTVDLLLENEVHVWVLDDLSTGKLRNLNRWKNDRRLHFKPGTITNYRTVSSLAERVDSIIHLAAVVSPAVSLLRPELTNHVNGSGTLNVLRAGLKHKVKRLVFASSSSLYGNATNIPIPETAPLEPITPYGVSKLAGEQYCMAFHRSFGLDTVSLRYFNVYGQRQSSNPYSGVIAIFTRQLLRGRRPTIYGDGNQTRDFIHVSDVARANMLALEPKRLAGEALNIGTGKATTINELLRTLADAVGKPDTAPNFAELRRGDIRQSCADTSKARAALGFEPRVALRDGLGLLLACQKR